MMILDRFLYAIVGELLEAQLDHIQQLKRLLRLMRFLAWLWAGCSLLWIYAAFK